ncbi:MAG TPA: gluconate 2-dehydrogenase subunit 3 family protein [Opitutaceae bacterium]|jgi:hypothetical protein
MTTPLETRRDAIRRILLLTGAAMVGSQAFLRGESLAPTKSSSVFSDGEVALLDEIGETILPATHIPGAKDVKIGAFMAYMVTDCYTDDQQAQFRVGLEAIDDASRGKFSQGFVNCTAAQRTEILSAFDHEAHAVAAAHAGSENKPMHFFRMFKDLTLLGYFSSEIGCTQAIRYIEVPGYYRGDVPYKKGDPAWGTF